MTGIVLLACIGAARADDEHFDVKADDAPRAVERAMQHLGGRISLTEVSCLTADKSGQKDVCTYRGGDGVLFLFRATPDAHDIDDVTLICTPKSPAVIVSCVTAYAALIQVFTPAVSEAKGREIVGLLPKGIGVGDSVQVTVDDNRYIAQKVTGTLWMHIEPGTG